MRIVLLPPFLLALFKKRLSSQQRQLQDGNLRCWRTPLCVALRISLAKGYEANYTAIETVIIMSVFSKEACGISYMRRLIVPSEKNERTENIFKHQFYFVGWDLITALQKRKLVLG